MDVAAISILGASDEESLWRDVHELNCVLGQEAKSKALLPLAEVAVDEGGGYLLPEEIGNLLGHQGLEGRDTERNPVAEYGGKLKAQRFARSGPTDHQDRLTRQCGQVDGQLSAAKAS